jgi:predicted nucleic acid-binding protein
VHVHGRYSRAEIEAAFGILRDDAPWIHREGVLWHEPSHTDLLFVTLNKSEALFSPSTRYRDLALALACHPDQPVVDCLYLTLARREAATLISLDRRLQQLAERVLP